ncbi:MAG TPA: MarR family transcriptional regulator [Cytophagaceae bacterium]
MKNRNLFYEAPLGLHFSNLAKQYLGVITKKLSHLDLERSYFTIVVIERLGGSVTQQQLGDYICKDKVSMVRIVDYLSKKGYVKRKKNKEDRREYFIELTEKAYKALPDIKTALKDANNATFKDISSEDIQTFYTVLEKLVCNLSVLPADKVDLNYRRIKQ